MSAWTATEDFESYGTGSISGANGGTGWSGAWTLDSGTVTVVASPARGTRAVLINSATSGDANRTLTTGVTSGSMRIYMYATTVPTGTKGFFPALFRDAGTIKFRLSWGNDVPGNNVGFGNGTTTETIGATPAAATWHYADIQFDQTNNRARASFNGGAFSAYITAAGGSFTSINSIRITNADGNGSDQGYYIDDIAATPVSTANSNFFVFM